MAKATVPEPNLRTPEADLSEVERIKLNSNGLRGSLFEELRDPASDDIMESAEQLAKSHGLYLEYNRAKTGREKDWMFMVRVSVPGGGPLGAKQWSVLDELSERFTAGPDSPPSLRVTTRQNIQFHWVAKRNVVELVRTIASTGFYTLNGCGDNMRNVMGCPLSRFSGDCDAHGLARRFGAYFRLPGEPHIEVFGIDPQYLRTAEQHFEYGPRLMNRKFKIAFAAVHPDASGRLAPDNCVEARTNDVGVVPVLRDGRVEAFQVYVGGGQGEKNGKPTFAALGVPLGVVAEGDLLAGLDAVAKVHQEWGDRQNRHWARLKYVVQKMGIEWYRQRVAERGARFEPPIEDLDIGPRRLHHGWQRQQGDGRWAFGAYVENGRIIDRGEARLKSMVPRLLERFGGQVMTTPNQDLLFTDIADQARSDFEAEMSRFGYGRRHGREYSTLRRLSGACVGLYTCRMSYAESEQFEPELIDELERRGYGDVAESIGITGCERGCFRPATKTIGWVGAGPDFYSIKLGGSEDASTQGIWLIGRTESAPTPPADAESPPAAPADAQPERWFLRQVPRKRVADVCAALFDFHRAHRLSDDEPMGRFHRRIGMQAIIDHLKAHPGVGDLMEKTYNPPYTPDHQRF